MIYSRVEWREERVRLFWVRGWKRESGGARMEGDRMKKNVMGKRVRKGG